MTLNKDSDSTLMSMSEDVRIRELIETEILDTPRNARFDEILDQLCEEVGCKFARLSFVDKERIWIKSKKGTAVTEFPRSGSVEDLLVRKSINILELANGELANLDDPFDFKKSEIDEIFVVAIRNQSSAIVGCLVLAFQSRRAYSVEFRNTLLSAATKYTEIIETRRAADSLLATLRDQQEEIRVRYSSERIARTLTSTVNDRNHYYQVVESFSQTILNEFDWWACQIWFESEGQLIPEKWIFGPSAPRTILNLEKIFSSPSTSPTNDETLSTPYSAKVSPILETPGLLWVNEIKRFDDLGLRTFLDVNVAGPATTSIRLLFVLPSSRVLPTRLKLTFENVISLLPQVLRRARSVEELNYRATHDELTGLLNRRGLDLEFPTEPSHEGSKRSRTIFFLDLDRFKLVNDKFGHLVGDELLVEISHRLMKSSRPVDAIARIGGDEFVIVAQGFDEADDIAKTSHRFLHNLGETFTASDGTIIEPRVSIGISTWDSLEALASAVALADKNMYAAKDRGGHQAVSDGWLSSDNFGLNDGEDYAIKFQSISDRELGNEVGLLVKIKLPPFFAPRLISDITNQICERAAKVKEPKDSRPLLMLEIIATSRSDRSNALSLIDSVAEQIGGKISVASVINLDSKILDNNYIAREIVEHGGSVIALGNVFDKPFDLQHLEELNPAFFIRSSPKEGWDDADMPPLSDRTSLAVVAELGITAILPVSYSNKYGRYLSKFPNVLYIQAEMGN